MPIQALHADRHEEKRAHVQFLLLQFEASLRRELAAAEADKPRFVADFSEEDYDAVVGGWAAKLARVAAGEQKWGLFTGRKPC